jgi:hypothetical protein
MKRLLLSSLLIASFFACKKDDKDEAPSPATPVDYRDVVVGNYVGTKNNYLWMMGMPPIVSDTTYAWTFSIAKDSTSDSTIIADGYLFKVDSNLHCYEVYAPGPSIRSFNLSNDTATIYFRSGGLGGYGTTTIIGVKQ